MNAAADLELTRRNNGELLQAMPVGGDAVPYKQSRLRLRQLSDSEYEEAATATATMANTLATQIDEANDWTTAEGYIGTIAEQIRTTLARYTVAPPPTSGCQKNRSSRHVRSPPPPPPPPPPLQPLRAHQQRRQTQTRAQRQQRRRQRYRPLHEDTDHREYRLEEALDDLESTQRANPRNQHAIHKARRRVGRVRDALEQTQLRKLFATNEQAAVEKILRSARGKASLNSEATPAETPATTEATTVPTSEDDNGRCPIPSAELEEYFRAASAPPRRAFEFEERSGAEFREAMKALPPATEAMDALENAPTLDEIENQLGRVNATSAPGIDGIGYDVLKRFAVQLLPLLHAAYRACWEHRCIPAVWKVSTVRLLYKKGERTRAANWRPIALQATLYKIYSGLLARRLSRWLEQNARLPAQQKGFRAIRGCQEHNLVATALLDTARRLHRPLYCGWYDLTNAFGSLPQSLMWHTLRALGVDARFISRCAGLYDGAHAVIVNGADGPTGAIEQRRGVFQGCPLSPLLFIATTASLLLALEKVDAGVQLARDVRLNTTAYADDLKTFADSAEGVKRCHAVVERFLKSARLRANPTKCATLGVRRNARGNLERDDTFVLRVHDAPIPSLTLKESYTYLGIGDGFDHVQQRFQLAPLLAEMKRDAIALLRSPLAPHQILKALKTFVYPRVEYALRHARPLQSQLEGFDRAVARGFRHLLRLPANATSAVLYAPTSAGGLGLLPLAEHHAALQIALAWQSLHSLDPAIRAIARTQVRQAAQKRFVLDELHWRGEERDEELVEHYLNGTLARSPYATAKRRNGDIGSLWSDVQRHMRAQSLQLETRTTTATADGEPAREEALMLRVPHHRDWLTERTVLRHVRLHAKLRHRDRWAAMADQGRTVRAHGRAGSKWVTTGGGMTDADYRFAFTARLNQLDTNTVLARRRLRQHATCRAPGCTRAETLAHVLQHCTPSADAITKRHDEVLAKIGTAVRTAMMNTRDNTELLLNELVPGYRAAALRPDIQLYNRTTHTAVVADLAVTLEEQTNDRPSTSTLQFAREVKMAKYAPIKTHLERAGWSVTLSAIVYGALGSVASGNNELYTEHFGILRRDARRLDLNASITCIAASRRVWNGYCSRHRTRQHAISNAAPGKPGTRGGGLRAATQ